MNIHGKLICGQPAIKIRDALRKAGGSGQTFDVTDFFRWYRTNEVVDEAEWEEFYKRRMTFFTELFEYFLENGYIEEVDDDGRKKNSEFVRKKWGVTLKGSGFTNASARKPYPKVTAVQKLFDFIRRVCQVHLNEDFLFVVDEVVVFGSILDKERAEVSDLDIAVRLVERPHKDREEYAARLCERAKLLGASEYYSSYKAAIACSNEVYKFLKDRKPIYSIHGLDSETVLKTEIPQFSIYVVGEADKTMDNLMALVRDQCPALAARMDEKENSEKTKAG